MAKKVFLRWNDLASNHSEDNAVYLTPDPLAKPPNVWFEDYFDYLGNFKETYRSAKEKSRTWNSGQFFQEVKILKIPVLNAYEHCIHSFWIQVERDYALIKNILTQLRPKSIVLSGARINIDGILSCQFDPGLFEFTCAHLAQAADIQCTISNSFPNTMYETKRARNLSWWKKIAGAISANIQSINSKDIARFATPPILVSPQVMAKIGEQLLHEAKATKIPIISTEPDWNQLVPTTYSLFGRSVGVLQRMRHYRKALKAFKRIPKSSWSDKFTKEGINYGPIAQSIMASGMKRDLWHECYRLLLIDRCITKTHPRAFMVIYDRGISETCSVRLAKKHGVRTITLQHGISSRYLRSEYPVVSDFFACWGQKEKDNIMSQGTPAERIVVTGFPLFDPQWKTCRTNHDSNVPIENGVIKVLIATQGVQSSVEWRFALISTARIIKEIIDLKLSRQKYHFIFRLHPNEELHHSVQKMAEGSGIQITKGLPIAEQFSQIDVVVTQYSTIGFEALLANKALISLNWVSEDEVIPFSESGAVARSINPNDFEDAIKNSLILQKTQYEKRNKFLQEYLYGPGATGRLMAVLVK